MCFLIRCHPVLWWWSAKSTVRWLMICGPVVSWNSIFQGILRISSSPYPHTSEEFSHHSDQNLSLFTFFTKNLNTFLCHSAKSECTGVPDKENSLVRGHHCIHLEHVSARDPCTWEGIRSSGGNIGTQMSMCCRMLTPQQLLIASDFCFLF